MDLNDQLKEVIITMPADNPHNSVPRPVVEYPDDEFADNVLSSSEYQFYLDMFDNINEPGAIKQNVLINKMNHDCLAAILMHLSILDRLEMEKVCRKWKEATQLSWYNIRKVDFKDLMILFDEREEIANSILVKCGKYLTHLTIPNDYHYPWTHDVVKNNCQNVTDFDIDMNNENDFDPRFMFKLDRYNIVNEDVVSIITSMTKLKYLKVSMTQNNLSNFCNNILEGLPANMEEIHLIIDRTLFNLDIGSVLWMLTQFDESEPSPVTEFDEGKPIPVLDKFSGLRCLTLQGFHLTPATMESIVLSKNTLVNLDLSNSRFPRGVLSIFSSLVNLELLNLWMVSNFDVNTIIEIAHNCLKLKHLEFKLTYQNVPVPYHVFSQLKYLNLEYLKIGEVDGIGNKISDITKNWKNLKYFDVGKGHGFSFSDIQELRRFNKLEFLNLPKITVNSLINDISNYPNLKELNMSFANIHEKDLEKLAILKKLEKLDFHGLDNLTGNVLIKIASNCKNLVSLNIGGCKNITEDSLIQVGKLKYLETLGMNDINNFPIPNSMFNNLCKLKDLSCLNCPSVTDETIIKVLDNCKNLSKLNLRRTGITVETPLYALKRQFVFETLTMSVDHSIENDYNAQSTFPLHFEFFPVGEKKYRTNEKKKRSIIIIS